MVSHKSLGQKTKAESFEGEPTRGDQNPNVPAKSKRFSFDIETVKPIKSDRQMLTAKKHTIGHD